MSVAQKGEACREIIGDTVRTGWLLSEIARNTGAARQPVVLSGAGPVMAIVEARN
jgi:hypothetical protein